MSLTEQAGEEAQALLRQLMTIYDVKTLVAELVSVGEQHWSAAILKRVAALGRAAGRKLERGVFRCGVFGRGNHADGGPDDRNGFNGDGYRECRGRQ